MLNKAAKIILILLLILAPMSFSYAEDIYESAQTFRTGGLGLPAALRFERIESEPFLFSKDIEKRAADLHINNSKTSSALAADIHNIPPSLVNNITYDFSYKRNKNASPGATYSDMSNILQIGAAFLTNLAVHEFGHEVVANYVDAEGSELNFFKKSGGDFFLGTSHVDEIDSRSVLSYTMGGEFFADLTFEHALKSYRNSPTTYSKSLLLTSGADFLWYCLYAFYIADDNPSYDPIAISGETGISRDMLFSVALAKTMINAYRIYAGHDAVVPYFKVDRHSASLNFMFPFEFGS